MVIHKEYIGNNTRLIEKLDMDGYVLNPEHIQKIVEIIDSSDLFDDDSNCSTNQELKLFAYIEDGNIRQFMSLTELVNYPNTSPEIITGLRIEKAEQNDCKVELQLKNSGSIIIDICGPTHKIEALVHSLKQHLRALDQKYSKTIKAIIINDRPRRLATFIFVLAVISLLGLIGFYIYGLQIGVDVDPDILPGSTAYATLVESAIQSDNINDKLNVLLIGNLRGFINVTDYFQIIKILIVGCLIVIFLLGGFIKLSKHLKTFFPLSFFAIGHQKEELLRLIKIRDTWVIAIIVGFLINIIAGIILTLFGG